MESHLLQMRGLKRNILKCNFMSAASHLLQMRGLKLKARKRERDHLSRIFYRCVD